MLFLTLTAPGEDQHSMPSGDVCACTPEGGVDLARWNGEAVHRWGRLRQALERQLGVRIDYFRATEVQSRGALHFHVVVRFSAPVNLDKRTVRVFAMAHGFGHAVDLQTVTDERAAGYCAKYASKSSAARDAAPYVNRRTGEIGPGRWRTWTASRTWGVTMRSLRVAQAEWAKQRAEEGPAEPAPTRSPLDTRGDHSTRIDVPLVPEVPTGV